MYVFQDYIIIIIIIITIVILFLSLLLLLLLLRFYRFIFLTNYFFISRNRISSVFCARGKGKGRESELEWGGGWIEG